MPDAHVPARIDAGAALRALPGPTPPRSAWPQLEAQLVRARARRRLRWLALPTAAALLLALLVPRLVDRSERAGGIAAIPGEPAAHAAVDVAPDRLTELMTESARLETLLEWSRVERVESAPNAVLAVALQGRIGHIDSLLARPEADPDALLPLWQERVLRLRQLAELEGAEQMLAAHGRSDDLPMLAF